ncbi:hypothetical protein R1flu_003027 [Riccia fluitans]|uniref:Uncharacterized protein n=1 Tax=Riccia fluitans TaxID=41844 RepID=A0ABD1YAU8_9MARC
MLQSMEESKPEEADEESSDSEETESSTFRESQEHQRTERPEAQFTEIPRKQQTEHTNNKFQIPGEAPTNMYEVLQVESFSASDEEMAQTDPTMTEETLPEQVAQTSSGVAEEDAEKQTPPVIQS